MISILDSAMLFFFSCLATTALAPVWIACAKKINLIDHPVAGKIHQRPVATAGGATIFFAFFLVLWLFFFYSGENFPIAKNHMEGLALAGSMILLLGIYDDFKGCGPITKLIIQTIVGAILYFHGFGIERITNPFGEAISLPLINIPITVFWIVLIVNAVNLIDGLDGLACGIIFISSCTISFIAFKFGEAAMMVPSLILAGASLGFLRHNFPPAKVFLGDTGSMFLGLMMAAISLLGNRKGTVTVTLLFPIVLMGVPLVDTIFAFVRRSLDRKNPFRHDTRHFHHRLLYLGLSQKRVALFIYLICIYLSLTAVILSIMPKQYVFLVLLILATGLLIGIETLKFIEGKVESFKELERRKTEGMEGSGQGPA